MQVDNTEVRNIVLASSSPRRREMLEWLGLTFVVEPPGIEEDMSKKSRPRNLVQRLALEKALAVAVRHPNAIVIAADTVVTLGTRVWSKPENQKQARMMLGALSGRSHDVWTGLCVIDTKSGRRIVNAERTRVWMRKLSTHDIKNYLATGESLEAAGAYKVQGKGFVLVSRIDGDYTNVVGLPLPALLKALTRLGIRFKL